MTAVATAPVPVVQERPILFSGPMVRAILADRKTQTRRLVRPQPDPQLGETPGPAWNAGFVDVRCPYGKPGDRLWVRETWQTPWMGATQMFAPSPEAAAMYRREPAVVWAADWDGPPPRKWRPSIHMPRWACRLVLEVIEVRVQRLQDITDADAREEGFSAQERWPMLINGKPAEGVFFDSKIWFACLWESINGKRAPWSSNPWVWAITFRRLP